MMELLQSIFEFVGEVRFATGWLLGAIAMWFYFMKLSGLVLSREEYMVMQDIRRRLMRQIAEEDDA